MEQAKEAADFLRFFIVQAVKQPNQTEVGMCCAQIHIHNQRFAIKQGTSG